MACGRAGRAAAGDGPRRSAGAARAVCLPARQSRTIAAKRCRGSSSACWRGRTPSRSSTAAAGWNWLAPSSDRNNPLTARVLVNRVWLHHFGTGTGRHARAISACAASRRPIRELLDHLATTFMDNGWSIKKLHRLILLSAVYQQSSDDRADGSPRRPGKRAAVANEPPPPRLRGDARRAAGRLRPARPHARRPAGQGHPRRRTAAHRVRLRRSSATCRVCFAPSTSPAPTPPVRGATPRPLPQQALFLMNNPFVIDCARQLVQLPEIAAEKDCCAARRVPVSPAVRTRTVGRGSEHWPATFTGGGVEATRLGAVRSGIVDGE